MLLFDSTDLDGLYISNHNPLSNDLGNLPMVYCREWLQRIEIKDLIVKINKTLTNEVGSILGMHFQCPPFAEDKIVLYIKGKIFDIAVDIRKNLSTFYIIMLKFFRVLKNTLNV